mgnify:CR=1 FL=1
MYAYFIDDWTSERKHLRAVDSLDLRLTQNGLAGRKIKLNRLHDLDASVRDLVENGARTFVAVGNDATASRLLNSLLKLEDAGQLGARKYLFAVLPIGEGQQIARSFGCAGLESAVLALKNRRTKLFDLGLLNKRHYFITAATFYGRAAVGFLSYSVSSLRDDYEISVCNTNIFGDLKKFGQQDFFNVSDGTLEAVISYPVLKSGFWGKAENSKQNYNIESVFPLVQITIQSAAKTIKVLADAEKELSTPVAVEVVPARLEAIVAAAGVK